MYAIRSYYGGGWRRAVNEAVGGTKGCTHLKELLMPAATVAFQTLSSWPKDRITSYNVCYTKLLREPCALERAPGARGLRLRAGGQHEALEAAMRLQPFVGRVRNNFV